MRAIWPTSQIFRLKRKGRAHTTLVASFDVQVQLFLFTAHPSLLWLLSCILESRAHRTEIRSKQTARRLQSRKAARAFVKVGRHSERALSRLSTSTWPPTWARSAGLWKPPFGRLPSWVCSARSPRPRLASPAPVPEILKATLRQPVQPLLLRPSIGAESVAARAPPRLSVLPPGCPWGKRCLRTCACCMRREVRPVLPGEQISGSCR